MQRQARQLDDTRAELGHVRAERDRLRTALAEQGTALEARARAEEARERDNAATIASLRSQLADVERRAAHSRDVAVRELEARVDELEGQALEAATLRAHNSELEAKLLALSGQPRGKAPRATAAKARQATNGSAHGDDLKRIRGIGPAFERALKAGGVSTFAQIAGWGADDVDAMARMLRVKPERIRKEDWVGAATSLLGSPEKE